MEYPILQALMSVLEQGRPVALATVISVQGASPARPGFKLLVYSDGTATGNVGGGELEARMMIGKAMIVAALALAASQASAQAYLGGSVGQSDIEPVDAEVYKLPSVAGAEITQITPGFPAERAGVATAARASRAAVPDALSSAPGVPGAES